MSMEEVAEAQLGEDAKSFLETTLGRNFTARAQLDHDNAAQALAEIDPYEFTTLIELQNAIAALQREMDVGQHIAQYLRDAMVNGELAWQQLERKEEHD